ncbi:MAG: hypothetical protein OXH57_07175 [Ekhidna sp.]|nr:hypothetical protein [Ekhidna sp.]
MVCDLVRRTTIFVFFVIRKFLAKKATKYIEEVVSKGYVYLDTYLRKFFTRKNLRAFKSLLRNGRHS